MLLKNGKFENSFPRGYKAKIALLADVHVGYDSWGDYSKLHNLFAHVNSKNADICLVLGDVIDSGYAHTPELMSEQRAQYYDCLKTLNIPHFAIQGNHDVSVDEFTRNGVIEINGIRLINFFASYRSMPAAEGAYNSTGEVSEETLEFIRNELAKTYEENKKAILCCHWSIADTTNFKWSLRDVQTDASGKTFDGHRDDIIALCEQYGCKLYLNGHEHKSGLVNAKCDDSDLLNVQIGTATSVYVIATIYNDNVLLEEFNVVSDEKLNELEVEL